MHKPDKNVLGYNEEGYNYDNPSLCSSHRLWTAQQIAFLNATGQFAKCVTLFNRLSLSHSSSLPSNLPPPPPSTIDPQQYIFASSPSLTLPRVTEEQRVHLLRSVQPRRTHPVLRGRRFSAARWPPGAAALYPVHAPCRLLPHTHAQKHIITPLWVVKCVMGRGGRMVSRSMSVYLCHICVSRTCCFGVGGLSAGRLPVATSSGHRRRQGRRFWSVGLRIIFGLFRGKDWLSFTSNNSSYPSCFRAGKSLSLSYSNECDSWWRSASSPQRASLCRIITE